MSLLCCCVKDLSLFDTQKRNLIVDELPADRDLQGHRGACGCTQTLWWMLENTLQVQPLPQDTLVNSCCAQIRSET